LNAQKKSGISEQFLNGNSGGTFENIVMVDEEIREH
jgi:hypothetical protein